MQKRPGGFTGVPQPVQNFDDVATGAERACAPQFVQNLEPDTSGLRQSAQEPEPADAEELGEELAGDEYDGEAEVCFVALYEGEEEFVTVEE